MNERYEPAFRAECQLRATMACRFAADNPGVNAAWRWAALPMTPLRGHVPEDFVDDRMIDDEGYDPHPNAA